jgi:hypothetical protein
LTTVHHLLTGAGSFVLTTAWVVIVTVGLSWLFTRGGAPSEENGTLHYKLRPGMRMMAYVLVLAGVYAVAVGCISLNEPRNLLWMLELAGGLGMLLGGAFMLSASLYLDDTGLHYRRGWKRVTSIGWKELDHYEVDRARRTNTSVYFFCSIDGTTIPVEETGYDVGDLLKHIDSRKKIREQPYQRRHWYGG